MKGQKRPTVDRPKRAAPGYADAFVGVVRRWQTDLYRLFRLLGAERHEAEDHVQETFLRLFRNRSRYGLDTIVGSPALVYRIARTVFLDSVRRSLRRPSHVSLCTLGDELPCRRKDETRLSELIDLRAAVGDLPEKLRWVVILNVYQGLEYRDVARALEIPVGTVKSRMHLALRRLRERTYEQASL